MSLKKLVHAGLGCVLESGVIEHLIGGLGGGMAGGAARKAIGVLKEHFTLSAAEIGRALQGSFGYATAAIAAGVAPPAQARALWQKLTASRISREYASQIAERYLEPFAREQGLAGEALDAFRAEVVEACAALARDKDKLFPAGEFPEPDLAALLQTGFSGTLSDLVLAQVGALEPAELQEFLAYQGLLGDALLYFFRETLRKDERVAKTLAALQTEGLWADLRDVKAAQQRIEVALHERLAALQAELAHQQQAVIQATGAGDFEHLPVLGQTLSTLKTESAALQARLSALPQHLQQAESAWRAADGRLRAMQERLGAWGELLEVGFSQVLSGMESLAGQIEHVDRRVGQVLSLLRDMMQRLDLGAQIKPRDELSQHNSASIKLIEQAVAELERVPRAAKGYSLAAINVGSVLSSAGGLERAERLFEQARAAARQPAEQALAAFNLFQVRLRRKAYPEALEALQAAIAIEPARYALHHVDKYPLERILGAGGMGVAFLCRDRLRGKVVVKAFWEAKRGPIEEVFREVLILKDVAGRYVPLPIDYDYADPIHQERPYIVTEYIDGAMDGEAWLERHGKLSLAEGIQVGVQVAKGLQAAHAAGVCHLDLKPANLLLKQTDQGLTVRIIDFGLARAVSSLRQDAAAQTSRSGKSLLVQEVFGTLEYAPPEQLGDPRYGEPGPQSDLFAFGATLYRLMTQKSPRALSRRALPPETPDALYDLLCDCLEENPAARPASAGVVVERTEGLMHRLPGPTAAPPPKEPAPPVEKASSEVILPAAPLQRGESGAPAVKRTPSQVTPGPVTQRAPAAPKVPLVRWAVVALMLTVIPLVIYVMGRHKVEPVVMQPGASIEKHTEPAVENSRAVTTSSSTLHVLSIGINRYQNKELSELENPANDAKAVAETVSRLSNGLFKEVRTNVMTDQQATLENIKQAFKQIAGQVRPNDVVLVYLSGQGVAIDGRYYFLPYDLPFSPSTEEAFKGIIKVWGLSQTMLAELVSSLAAPRVAILIDTCHAGAAAEAIARNTGRFVLAATRPDEMAADDVNGHGLFTGVVLAGLMGKADEEGDHNGRVDVGELSRYAERHVPEEVHKIVEMAQKADPQNAKDPQFGQHPTAFVAGDVLDFNLTAPGLHSQQHNTASSQGERLPQAAESGTTNAQNEAGGISQARTEVSQITEPARTGSPAVTFTGEVSDQSETQSRQPNAATDKQTVHPFAKAIAEAREELARIDNLTEEVTQKPGDTDQARACRDQAVRHRVPDDKRDLYVKICVEKRTKRDLSVAELLRAAEGGNADAQNKLGVMYQEGRGVPRDCVEAVRWFRRAAGQGNPYAQYNLGLAYQEGRGVNTDKQEAITWFRKAAKQGHREAQLMLMQLDGESGKNRATPKSNTPAAHRQTGDDTKQPGNRDVAPMEIDISPASPGLG